MSEEEFDLIADSFRDPRVWWIQDGEWYKDNIWGEPSSYGKVLLSEKEQERYYWNNTKLGVGRSPITDRK